MYRWRRDLRQAWENMQEAADILETVNACTGLKSTQFEIVHDIQREMNKTILKTRNFLDSIEEWDED